MRSELVITFAYPIHNSERQRINVSFFHNNSFLIVVNNTLGGHSQLKTVFHLLEGFQALLLHSCHPLAERFAAAVTHVPGLPSEGKDMGLPVMAVWNPADSAGIGYGVVGHTQILFTRMSRCSTIFPPGMSLWKRRMFVPFWSVQAVAPRVLDSPPSTVIRP